MSWFIILNSDSWILDSIDWSILWVKKSTLKK
jgi:hypothetical protein